MSHPLHFALVGCGRIGARHAALMQQHGMLVAVCDTDSSRAADFAWRYSARPFESIEDMLKANALKIDVVVICSPNGWHARHSIASLQAGANVLCEKPMAIAGADADAMIKAALKAERHLMVVKQNRFNPPVVAVKSLLEQGRLGRLLQVQCNGFWNRPADYYHNSWRGTALLDGGTLYTQFSHFIDLLIWLCGPIKILTATTARQLHTQLEIEDTGLLTGRFEAGALLGMQYTVNAYAHNMEGSITIFGEKGTLKMGGQYLNELEYQQLEGAPLPGLPPGNPPNQYGRYTGSMSNHPQVYMALMELLATAPKPQPALYQAADTVHTIEQFYSLANSSAAARPTTEKRSM